MAAVALARALVLLLAAAQLAQAADATTKDQETHHPHKKHGRHGHHGRGAEDGGVGERPRMADLLRQSHQGEQQGGRQAGGFVSRHLGAVVAFGKQQQRHQQQQPPVDEGLPPLDPLEADADQANSPLPPATPEQEVANDASALPPVKGDGTFEALTSSNLDAPGLDMPQASEDPASDRFALPEQQEEQPPEDEQVALPPAAEAALEAGAGAAADQAVQAAQLGEDMARPKKRAKKNVLGSGAAKKKKQMEKLSKVEAAAVEAANDADAPILRGMKAEIAEARASADSKADQPPAAAASLPPPPQVGEKVDDIDPSSLLPLDDLVADGADPAPVPPPPATAGGSDAAGADGDPGVPSDDVAEQGMDQQEVPPPPPQQQQGPSSPDAAAAAPLPADGGAAAAAVPTAQLASADDDAVVEAASEETMQLRAQELARKMQAAVTTKRAAIEHAQRLEEEATQLRGEVALEKQKTREDAIRAARKAAAAVVKEGLKREAVLEAKAAEAAQKAAAVLAAAQAQLSAAVKDGNEAARAVEGATANKIPARRRRRPQQQQQPPEDMQDMQAEQLD